MTASALVAQLGEQMMAISGDLTLDNGVDRGSGRPVTGGPDFLDGPPIGGERMNIYIPTLGRLKTQLTWDLLPEFLRDRTVLVVPPEEVTEHHRRGRKALACPETGIAKVREWIIHYARERGDTRIGVLDDDLKRMVYSSRPQDFIPGLPWNIDIPVNEWVSVLDWIDSRLDITSTCGLADGSMPPIKPDEKSPWRLMRNHFYNLETLPIDHSRLVRDSICRGFPYHPAAHCPGATEHRQPPVSRGIHELHRMRVAVQPKIGTVETHNEAMRQLIDHHAPWVRQSN